MQENNVLPFRWEIKHKTTGINVKMQKKVKIARFWDADILSHAFMKAAKKEGKNLDGWPAGVVKSARWKCRPAPLWCAWHEWWGLVQWQDN
jgi:hypothetical protein